MLSLIAVLAWWKAISASVKLALHTDASNYILLIVPISVVLIFLQWKHDRWEPVSGGRAAVMLLACAVAIGLLGTEWGPGRALAADTRLAIEMFALVVWWMGSFLLCFGSRIFRQCSFALTFLLLAIPIPGVVLNRIVEFLQQGTALCARGMLELAGVPVTQRETFLTIPGLTIEVAQECSSIRSSTLLVVTSIVMSYALLHSFLSRACVILIAMVLAVVKNGFRVFTLLILTKYVNPGILDSRLHRDGGILFFALGLGGVFAAIFIARKIGHWTKPIGSETLPGVSAQPSKRILS